MNNYLLNTPESKSPEYLRRQPTDPEISRLNTVNVAVDRLEQVLAGVVHAAKESNRLRHELVNLKTTPADPTPSETIASIVVESSSKDESTARDAVLEALQDVA